MIIILLSVIAPAGAVACVRKIAQILTEDFPKKLTPVVQKSSPQTDSASELEVDFSETQVDSASDSGLRSFSSCEEDLSDSSSELDSSRLVSTPQHISDCELTSPVTLNNSVHADCSDTDDLSTDEIELSDSESNDLNGIDLDSIEFSDTDTESETIDLQDIDLEGIELSDTESESETIDFESMIFGGINPEGDCIDSDDTESIDNVSLTHEIVMSNDIMLEYDYVHNKEITESNADRTVSMSINEVGLIFLQPVLTPDDHQKLVNTYWPTVQFWFAKFPTVMEKYCEHVTSLTLAIDAKFREPEE